MNSGMEQLENGLILAKQKWRQMMMSLMLYIKVTQGQEASVAVVALPSSEKDNKGLKNLLNQKLPKAVDLGYPH